MKEIIGGCWLAGLLAGALGLTAGAIIFGCIGAAFAAAAWYGMQQQEERAASWRKNYPTYKY